MEIIGSSSEDELNIYCEEYNGFYRYMRLLERLAQGTASDIFDDILQ